MDINFTIFFLILHKIETQCRSSYQLKHIPYCIRKRRKQLIILTFLRENLRKMLTSSDIGLSCAVQEGKLSIKLDRPSWVSDLEIESVIPSIRKNFHILAYQSSIVGRDLFFHLAANKQLAANNNSVINSCLILGISRFCHLWALLKSNLPFLCLLCEVLKIRSSGALMRTLMDIRLCTCECVFPYYSSNMDFLFLQFYNSLNKQHRLSRS